MKVKFIAIAALGLQRQIGLHGKLPWDLPDEYEHYKETVKGQYVLVGRKNFEANGGDIEGSKPIVLSRTKQHIPEAISCVNMQEVVSFAESQNIEKIYVIGGGEIYNLSLPYLSEFICSVVDYDGPADVYFPEYMSYEWEVMKTQIHEKWTMYHMKKRPDF